MTTAIALAALVLRLGRVDRITFHPDGRYPESDTDHTVMLALVAGEYAPDRLDRGLVLAFALVHDLVEADAGDTPTLVALTAEQRAEKGAREAAALQRMRVEIGPDSWVVRTIEAYERQDTPEAQWVHAFDKCMPKLTHALNGGVAIRRQGVTLEATRERVRAQIEQIADDLPEAAVFAYDAWALVEQNWLNPTETTP